MTEKDTIKKVAEKVHQAVLLELNSNEHFKNNALRSYCDRLELEDFDVSQYALIPRHSINENAVRIEEQEFEVSNYTFEIKTFNYAKKPTSENIGLIPKVSIETGVITGTFSIDDNDEVTLQIHTDKLVSKYEISERIDLKRQNL